MKLFKFSLFLFSIILLLTGCNQIENDVPATVVLEASKTSNIKKGEPVLFKFNNIPDESDVLWKVYPDSGVNLTAGGNKASVLFSIAGDYEINATFGSAIVGTNVHVADSVYVPVQNNIAPIEPDETLSVSVSITDSSTVEKPGVLVHLTFTTSNKYNCLNNYLVVKQDRYPNYVNFSFDGVFLPDSRFCSAGEKAAQYGDVLNFDPTSAQRHRIEISFLGKTYKGYYYVQDNLFFIDWPYTEGIIFTNAIIIEEDNGEASGFDIDNPDVDLFVSLLKSGMYKFYYDTAEYGENLLVMPKFNLNHLEALLEYAQDTTIISNFPTNPFDRSISPYPVGRDYFILNECLLWIVEGIRTGRGYEFRFPSRAPYLVDNSKPSIERDRGLSVSEILDVGELYYSWWWTPIIEWWLQNPPLEGTSYSWF